MRLVRRVKSPFTLQKVDKSADHLLLALLSSRQIEHPLVDKGKPGASPGRKATGPTRSAGPAHDCRCVLAHPVRKPGLHRHHLHHRPQLEGRDTAFNHLSTRANPGDRITLTTRAGPVTYTVKTVSTENKNTLKDSPIWNKVPRRLILISCYTADLWGTNIIITADQTPTP